MSDLPLISLQEHTVSATRLTLRLRGLLRAEGIELVDDPAQAWVVIDVGRITGRLPELPTELGQLDRLVVALRQQVLRRVHRLPPPLAELRLPALREALYASPAVGLADVLREEGGAPGRWREVLQGAIELVAAQLVGAVPVSWPLPPVLEATLGLLSPSWWASPESLALAGELVLEALDYVQPDALRDQYMARLSELVEPEPVRLVALSDDGTPQLEDIEDFLAQLTKHEPIQLRRTPEDLWAVCATEPIGAVVGAVCHGLL